MLLRPLQSSFGAIVGREISLSIAGFVGFSLLILWEVSAVYFGKKFQRAVDKEETIC